MVPPHWLSDFRQVTVDWWIARGRHSGSGCPARVQRGRPERHRGETASEASRGTDAGLGRVKLSRLLGRALRVRGTAARRSAGGFHSSFLTSVRHRRVGPGGFEPEEDSLRSSSRARILVIHTDGAGSSLHSSQSPSEVGPGGFEPEEDVLTRFARCARLPGLESVLRHDSVARGLLATGIVGPGGFEPPTSAL